MRAVSLLEASGRQVSVIKLLRISPFSDEVIRLIRTAAAETSLVYIAEEGSKAGGIGEKLVSRLSFTVPCRIRAVDAVFPKHASVDELRMEFGLDGASVAEEIETLLQ